MVGKEDKPHPTQEQLRIARLTQETTHSNDTDDARFLKLLKKVLSPLTKLSSLVFKVMETTRCSQTVAEIALYDTDNNVEAAVDAILEKSLSDDWQKQKSRKTKNRKTKRSFSDRKRQNSVVRLVIFLDYLHLRFIFFKLILFDRVFQQQNQNRAYRGNQARRGGHGAAGNGGERRGLGVRGGRGGAKPFRGGAGGGAGGGNGRIGTWQQEQENTWDNSMASNPTWTADDTAEDTEWVYYFVVLRKYFSEERGYSGIPEERRSRIALFRQRCGSIFCCCCRVCGEMCRCSPCCLLCQ